MQANNKIALVTGASQGIGKAVAHALLKDGFSVVLTSRRIKELEKALNEVDAYRKNALTVQADVSDHKSVSALFEKTIERFGRLDFLFNNAGIIYPPTPIEEIPYLDWQAMMNTNVTGTFLCTQEAFRIMKNQSPQGGRIINNGSVAAQTPRPNFASYTTTKHAITGITKSTALEGRDFNIACGQIDIGNANTEIIQKGIALSKELTPEILNRPMTSLESISKMIVLMANLPLEENVLFTTMLATKMPFVGRG